MADLVTVLGNAQSPNLQLRTEAEAHLNQAIEAQYGPFLLALCAELATEGKPENSRQLAGLYIKNLISAKDQTILEKKVDKWLECDASIKDQIRTGFLQAILSPVGVVSHTSAQILAAYGAVDVQRGDWPSLLPALLNNVANPEIQVKPKVSSLEALGYMCDAMDPDEVDNSVIGVMLSAIIDGMRADRPNEVRLAGVVALNNSLTFAQENFSKANERDMIMRTVCESTQCTDMKVREKAFECIARIGDLYYDKLTPYVDTLFQLTTQAIRSDDPSVGMQAIEFWSTVCDCETSVLEDINDGVENAPLYLKLVQQAAPMLVPIMLNTLSKQEEDSEGDDNWSIAMAGATCLEAMARTITDEIVGLTLPFVTQHITSSNWRFKEAAIMAFGSILDGPSQEKLVPIVGQAMAVLISCLKDPTPMVRDTTAWTIGKICEYHKAAITQEMLQPVVEGLSLSLADSSPKVASQACYAIHSLAEACSGERDHKTNVLSQFMPFLLEKLLMVTNREDWDSENLRASAYEAVNMIVTNCGVDMRSVVVHLLSEALNRLEATFAATFDPSERMNLQSLLCSLIGVCAQKLSAEELAPLSDRIMQLLLQVFSAKGAIAHEDAFMSIGFMSDKLGEGLSRYMPFLQPAIILGLKNVEEYQVCTVCVGVVGDVCRSLHNGVAQYCDEIMRCLLELLQSPIINRSVKPHVISLFADIAMAIEGDFDRYTSIVLGILKQAGEVNMDDGDEDLVDYINSLRVAIMEAYTGIVQGLKEAKKEESVVPALDAIVELLQRSTNDEHKSEEVLKAAVGLLGDLGQIFGSRMAQVYRMPFVMTVFNEGLEYEDMVETTKWAQEIAQKVVSGKPV